MEKNEVKKDVLIKASAAWDGSALPSYPADKPEISIIRYTFPSHSVTDRHFHKVINCGMVISGTLTVVNDDGTSRDFHAGQPIIETVGTIHHGENRGDIPVDLVMFYASDSDTPLSNPA